MTLIEGIGDEVTHFFIALIAIIIVSLAWWTTNISDQRHVRTVLLLDRRRHRSGHHHRRLTNLTNHTETVTITEGSTSLTRRSSAEMRTQENGPETSENGNGANEGEETTIIRTMDEVCSLRQRRLAFYDNFSQNNSQDEVENRVEEIPSQTEDESPASSQTTTKPDTTIRIKLKYINDDLKFVDGHLNEPLGDFKKRHFQVEMNSNKLVRLIFNGQVLQQDTQTLKSIGLFDNCVVHCLIHQKRVTPGSEATNSSAGSNRDNSSDGIDGGANANNNNNNQAGRDWDFGNSLFAFISFMLLAAWYFRYVYAHLYTVTATVGLILITGIFTIVLVGMYFPDNENLPSPRIHIHTTMATDRENAPQPAQQ